MEMMLDSGSAVSLIRKDMISPQMINIVQVPLPPVKPVTAAGDDLVIVDYQRHQGHSKGLWMKSFMAYHLLLYI